MIELIRTTRQYPKQRGIQDITLRVEKGEWVLIEGATGAGKTTLLRLVYAAELPDSGEVIVGSYRLSTLRRKDIAPLRRMLGIVDQDLALFEDRTVLRNVILVGEILGWSRKKTRLASLSVLNKVGLYDHLDMFPYQLSYGERRRLAIARAMVSDPFALIADEPLSHLDQETARGIVEILARFHARGTSILIATHRASLFQNYPVRIVNMEKGRIVTR